MARNIFIGTSGWNYDHWRGNFYPLEMPQQEWLSYYCSKFNTVEVNNTFYKQPANHTFDQWHDEAPPGFLFAVKASRYLTHMRKLNKPREPLKRLLRGARRLKTRLGPILYQLPPNWKKNLKRLREFVQILPTDLTHVIEFRERDWLTEETYSLLAEHNICLCVHDMLPRHPRRVTGPAIYVRFHGTGEKYGGKYRPSRLKGWANWLKDQASGHDVFVYFNNDANGHAICDAQELRRQFE